MIITIDGPVATGKSTIAKKLAEELGYIFFDTGAMYRALTYAIIKNNVDADNPQALEEFLKKFNFDIKIQQRQKKYFANGEDVTGAIRSEKVTSTVSKISAIPAVREKLTAIQRQFALGVNAVFEGRDMGTTVFPDAKLKIFLSGRPEVRAKRRFEEIQRENPEEAKMMTLEQVLDSINQRDAYDSSRTLSPLKKADDAYVIDTSDLTIDEVVLKIHEYKDTLKTRQ